jgi:aminoglycoside phosphotransferase (APT) family kinase protein
MVGRPKEDEYAEALQAYLRSTGIEGLAQPGSIRIRDLSPFEKQGLSNKTYLLRLEIDHRLADDLILRLYGGDGAKAAREFKIMSFMWSRELPIPRAYVLEDSGKVLGRPFIIVERIRHVGANNVQEVIDGAARSLVQIHDLDQSEVISIIKSKGDYLQREIKGIKALILVSALSTLRLPMAYRKYWRCANDIEDHPVEARLRLIHGDYGLDNTIYTADRTYVVDWENVDIGEPTFDVAYAYNFLDFDDEMAGRHEDKLSDRFLGSYSRYGGTIRDLQFYRRLAALKLLVLLDAITFPGLISLLMEGARRFPKSAQAKLFLKELRAYLLRVLEGITGV